MTFQALVIGAGSVGQHHVARCIGRYGNAVVVDPNGGVQQRMKDSHGDRAQIFASLEEAMPVLRCSKDVIAIVSNWGPDHLPTVERLVNRGIRRILVEKPATNSLLGSERLRTIAASGVTIIVGLQRRFTGLDATVRAASEEYCGSEPTGIVAIGGALDVSTNGIHLLDLAANIFREEPIRVTGDGGCARINPRSDHLLFWDGVVVWTFPSGRRFSIHFDNKSSVSAEFRVFARNGRLTVNDQTVDVAFREGNQSADRVTRHGPPSQALTLDVPGATTAYDSLFQALENEDSSKYPVREAMSINDALLCGLHALEHRTTVQLPATHVFSGFTTEWAAS